MSGSQGFRVVAAAVLAITALVVAAGPAPAATKWDFSLFVGITHPVGQYHKEFADEVKKRTGGALEIIVRPAGELPYKPTEVTRIVGEGTLALADGYMGFIAGDAKVSSLPGMPFLVGTAEELQKAMEAFEPLARKELDRFGVTILFWYTWPPQNVWGRGKPITTIDDFKGRKIRTTSPEQTEMLKRFGAIPVSFTTAEVPPAAQRGAMEAVLTASFNLLGAKWYEFSEWGYIPDIHIGGPSYILVNKKALESLPADARTALQAVAKEFHDRMLREIPARDAEARKILVEQHKIRLIPPQPGDTEKGRKIMEPYWEQWAKERGPAGVEALQAVRKALGR